MSLTSIVDVNKDCDVLAHFYLSGYVTVKANYKINSKTF